MKFLSYTSLAVAGLAIASVGAQAQVDQGNANNDDIAVLTEWSYDPIYEAGGLRSEYLLDAEVFGPAGEEIGNVENVLISEGRIVAIIAEVGGFWDIGDVHIAVPWDEVELIPDGFQIPVSEGNFEQYALFNESSFVNQAYLQQVGIGGAGCAGVGAEADAGGAGLVGGDCTWRLTALIGDYATLSGGAGVGAAGVGAGYGYVEGVIFSRDGEIQAVIIEPTVAGFGYGTYAFPFYGYGYGWNPASNVYGLPYGADAVGALEPFDYDQFDGFW